MGVGTTSFLLELEDSCPPHTSTCTIAGMATVALLWDPGPPYLTGFESYNIFFEFPMSLALIKLQKPCGETPLRQLWVRIFLKGRGAFCCIMWAAHLDP